MIMKMVKDKNTRILIFLGFFGFALGLFSNYRELWLSANGITPESISRVISIASFITILVLLYFTFKISVNRLKNGISIVLILKLITSTILICLNNSNYLFLIKFLMFFDIAFSQIILANIYPLIMSINKNDLLYTKKDVVEALSSKLGFLIMTILLGKSIGKTVINYNTSFLLSVIFIFISFIVFINIDIPNNNENKKINLKKVKTYFKNNKIFILYLLFRLISSIVWNIALGMPLLTLTKYIGLKPKIASFIILGLGILSNILAIIIVKYLKFKNDYLNLLFKYGIRIILYLLMLILNNNSIFLITFVYMLLTDMPYSFIIDSFYTNKVDNEYSSFFVTLKYAISMLATSIGILICGKTFNMEVKFIGFILLILSLIYYFFACILINRKKS